MARKKKLPSGLWDRSGTYYARFRAHGRPVCKKLSRDYRAACEMLNEFRVRADKADFGIVDNDHPWSDLKREFLAWMRQQNRSAEDYGRSLNWFENYCPVKSVRQVSHQYVIGFRQWRLESGTAPGTVNKNVAHLSSMLGKGVEWQLLGSNPIAGLKRLPVDELVKDRRPLTLDEVDALLRHSPADLVPVWLVFVSHGLRHVELVDMLFDDVDFERKEVTVRRVVAKSRKSRIVPLSDEVLGYIAELKRLAPLREPVKGNTPERTKRQLATFSRDHVFVTRMNTPMRNGLLKRFYTVCKRAGIEDAHQCGSVDIHSLRVTYATLSIEHGADPKALQANLGHSTLDLTMNTYAKATDQGKRRASGVLPFATMSSPEGVIPLSNVDKARASNSESKHSPNPSMAGQTERELIWAWVGVLGIGRGCDECHAS